ncbi:histidine kinase [Pseudofrankia sp. BMG5.36]|uniref:sensor histidine kinase n=1 Tax=Pseudofrankia sp. BMG5.36 TaxID=1834512 RepID=UPI0008DA331F|nr:histidine kinase [Pseudofrankia sp. BMG5.36]OHV48828.1 hypothetical protein BCD48_14445 [Pseudofrankia sp. BMG5.36]
MRGAWVVRTVRRFVRAPAADVVLAAAVAGNGLFDALKGPDWPPDASRPAIAVLALISAACLALRRRRPLLAFTGIMAPLTAILVVFGHYENGWSLLVALVAAYSVGVHGTNPPYAGAVMVCFAAAMGLRQPSGDAYPDMVFTAVALGLPFAVGLTVRALRGRGRLLEQRAQALEREQEQRAATAVAAERRRIARELHDIISHSLGIVVLQAGVVEQVLERDPAKARAALALIRATGQEAIGEMGTLVGLIRDDTRAPLDPQPTLADLDRLVATTRALGLPVRVVTEGPPDRLPAAVELSAYRVVQESLTNALKHAGKAQVDVVLRYRPHDLEVEVSDDGADGRQGTGGRHGLTGLKERVAVFGGRFEAGRGESGGWTVRASFPTAR